MRTCKNFLFSLLCEVAAVDFTMPFLNTGKSSTNSCVLTVPFLLLAMVYLCINMCGLQFHAGKKCQAINRNKSHRI